MGRVSAQPVHLDVGSFGYDNIAIIERFGLFDSWAVAWCETQVTLRSGSNARTKCGNDLHFRFQQFDLVTGVRYQNGGSAVMVHSLAEFKRREAGAAAGYRNLAGGAWAVGSTVYRPVGKRYVVSGYFVMGLTLMCASELKMANALIDVMLASKRLSPVTRG